MKKTHETIGQIIVESELGEKTHTQTHGAEFLRKLVRWMDARNESLNDGKSPLDLIREFKDSVV